MVDGLPPYAPGEDAGLDGVAGRVHVRRAIEGPHVAYGALLHPYERPADLVPGHHLDRPGGRPLRTGGVEQRGEFGDRVAGPAQRVLGGMDQDVQRGTRIGRGVSGRRAREPGDEAPAGEPVEGGGDLVGWLADHGGQLRGGRLWPGQQRPEHPLIAGADAGTGTGKSVRLGGHG